MTSKHPGTSRKNEPEAESIHTNVDPDSVARHLLEQGVALQHKGKFNEAISAYKRVLTLKPGHADANNNLGFIYVAQGNLKEARRRFMQVLVRRPQLLGDFASVSAMLHAVNPALAAGVKRAATQWPKRVPATELLRPRSISDLAIDPVLTHVLTSTTIRDVPLERLLTCVRIDLLRRWASDPGMQLDEHALGFYSALARQCFINEYVFATAAEEEMEAGRLRQQLLHSLAVADPIPPALLIIVASYFPLHAIEGARALLEREWPVPMADLLAQQVREPLEEVQLRSGIRRLTAVQDEVSLRVRDQYEQNPYPRWVHTAAVPRRATLDQYIVGQFPGSPFRPLGKTERLDVLVAGCGTGRHSIELADKFLGARVLAVDLSLASLAYAQRKTPAALASEIEYAQGDLLELASIGRSFDLIDATGVLHHLGKPFEGWRSLLSLLSSGGVMRVGLYSRLARRHIMEARAYLESKGYEASLEDIRRCRQDLLMSPHKDVASAGDFFCTSECRDLLFHAQESQMSIPEVKFFLAQNDLQFIGFELPSQILEVYANAFGANAPTSDLERWHALETRNPAIFAGMYQFFVQRT